jgi:hypothetical protein
LTHKLTDLASIERKIGVEAGSLFNTLRNMATRVVEVDAETLRNKNAFLKTVAHFVMTSAIIDRKNGKEIDSDLIKKIEAFLDRTCCGCDSNHTSGGWCRTKELTSRYICASCWMRAYRNNVGLS